MEKTATPLKKKVFLASYKFLFPYGLGMALCLFVVVYPFLYASPTLGGLFTFLAQILLPLLILYGLATFPLTWMYRVRITADGIHGGTIWSTPVYMSWAEMESVEPRSVLGMPYLRVKSFRESCPSLWLPRFLANPAAFRETVTAHTSPLHPLRRSLENGNTPEKRERLAA